MSLTITLAEAMKVAKAYPPKSKEAKKSYDFILVINGQEFPVKCGPSTTLKAAMASPDEHIIREIPESEECQQTCWRLMAAGEAFDRTKSLW